MNKIFKVIFSKAKGCYVVVSELAKSAGKGTSASHIQRGYSLTLAAAVLSMMMGMAPVGAVGLGNEAAAVYDDKGNLTIGDLKTVAEGDNKNGWNNTTIGTQSDTLRNVTEGDTEKNGQPLDDDKNTKLVDGEGKAHDLTKSTEAGRSTAVGYQSRAEGDDSTAIGNNAKITNKPVTYYVDADGNKTASRDNAVWYKDTSGKPTKVPQVFRDANGNTTATPQYVHTYTEKDPDTKEDVTKTEITSDATKADKDSGGNPVYNYRKEDNTDKLYSVTLYQAASNSIAAGTNVTAKGSNAVAVGYNSKADNSAVAIGDTADAGENAVAIGKGTKASAEGSIALGKGSEADRDGGVAGWDPKTGTASAKTNAAWQSGEGALSIGNGGASRQITNVAAGSEDSDAVNLAQLKNAMTHYYSVKTTSDTDAAGNNNYLNDGATGDNALAAGVSAAASGVSATAVGYNTSASGSDAAAFGSGSKVTDGGVAVGSGATASGNGVALGSYGVNASSGGLAVGMYGTNASSSSAAFGLNNTTATNGSVAVGANGTTANNSSFAAGFTSKAGANGSSSSYGHNIAVGSNTTADNGSSAFGINATANYQSLAIGLHGNSSSAYATNQSIAVGNGTNAFNYSTAIGNQAQAGNNGSYAVALGNEASALYDQTTAIGSGAKVISPYGTALGSGTSAAYYATALGNSASANFSYATAIGSSAQATDTYATAVGNGAKANKSGATALGYSASATHDYSTAVGDGAGAHGTSATALGNGASANSDYDTAIGSGAATGGGNGTALGYDAKAQSPYATALGSGASASYQAIALGYNAKSNVTGGVALGSGSTAYRESGQAGLDTVSGALSSSTDPAWKSTYGAISVGNFTRSDDGKTVTVNGTRQIVGVAAGSEDTDAVNVAQLKAALRQTGTGTIHDYSVNSTNTTTDTNYNYDADTGSNALAAGVSAKATGVRSVAVGNGAKAQGVDSIAIGTNAVATGIGAMVIGQYNTAEGQNSLAFGGGYNDANKGNKASSTAAVAFGERSWAMSEGSVAFGYGTQAGNMIKDKNNVKYTGQNAVAFGNGTKALGGRSLAFGENTTANYNDSVAFGNGATAFSSGATAFGNRSRALSQYSTSFGDNSVAAGSMSFAFGTDTIAGAALDDNGALELTDGSRMDSYGNKAYTTTDTAGNKVTYSIKGMDIPSGVDVHDYVVVTGTKADGTTGTYVQDYQGGIAEVKVNADGTVTKVKDLYSGKLGGWYQYDENGKLVTNAKGTYVVTPSAKMTSIPVTLDKATPGSNGYTLKGFKNATAFGYSTEASGDNATAFGNDTKAKASAATAFGTTTTASGDNATAFGLSTTASGKQTTAFGSSTTASGDNATAFGENSTASGEAATAFGIGSSASGKNSLAALGGTASAENAAAIGNGAQATLADSVALGSNSKATRAKYIDLTVEKEKAAYAKYGSTGPAWEATANAIAVGNDSTTTRQITGVAAGSLDTDAVNVAQLRAVDAKHTIVTVGGQSATEDNTPVNGGNLDLKRTTATNGQETYDLSLDKNVTLGEQVENEGGKLTVNNVDKFKNSDKNGDSLPDTTVKEAVKIDGKTVSVVKHDGSDADNDQRQVVLGVDQDAGGYVTLYDNTGKKPTYIYNAISGGITYLKDKDSYLTPDPTKPNDERASNEFNRLEYGDYHTGTVQFIATLDDGQKYAGDNYQAAETETKTVDGKTTTTVTKEEQNVLLKKLNERLDIKGGATGTLTDNNIGVNVENGVMKVQLAQNIDLGGSGSVTMGNTTINNGGVIITTKDGDKVTNTISLTDNGLNNGGKTITNVEGGTNPTDAVNVSQLNAAKTTVTSNDHSVTIDTTTDSTDNHKNYDLKIATATLSQDKTTGDNPVETGKVTVSNPKISVTENGETKQVDNPNAYVTGNSVADAINNSGFKLTASASEGAVTGNKETLIHPGDTMTIDAGKNISLTQDKGKISIATKDNLNLGSADSKDDKQQDVPGTNGSITVNGKNGSSVAINGQDGSIGLTGPKGTDGTSTSIQMSTIMSDPTLDDDKNTKTTSGEGERQTTTTQAPRIQYKNGNTTYEVATMDDGQNYAGDVQASDAKANAFSRKLNEQTNIVGGVKNLDALSTGNNVGVVSNGTDTLTIRLAKELTDLTSVTTVTKDAKGNKTSETVQDGNGITITPTTVGEGKSSVSLTDKGLSNGGNQITHVDSGLKDATGNTVDLAAASGDVLNNAVNVGDLQKVQKVASAHTAVTVNGGVGAPGAEADGNLGSYTDKEKGNLLLAQKKDITTGQITYDLKLNDNVILGKDGSDGKDGQEGTLGLTGKDGLPGADGKQGYSTTLIKTEKGQAGADGKTGKEDLNGTDMTRIVYTDKDGGNPQTVATMDDGLKFAGDDVNTTVAKKLNSTLQIRGDGTYDETTKQSNGNIQTSVENGTIKVALNDKINLHQDGSLTVGGDKQDDSTDSRDPIVIKHFDDKTLDVIGVDKDGKPTTSKEGKAGDYVTGLDNKDWDVSNPTYVSGRAATEDQLKEVSNAVTKATETAGKHTVVTVEGGKDAGTTNYNGENLKLKVTDTAGQKTYDLKLNDNLSLGTVGKDGEKGTDGSIGLKGADGKSSIGLNGKDGISVIGKDGKNGVSITGSNGLNGKDGIDGKIAIGTPGKDGQPGKDAVSISGQNGIGHIGLTGQKGEDGKDGVFTDLSTTLGTATLDPAKNEQSKSADKVNVDDKSSRIQYQTTVTDKDGKTKTVITHEVATMDDGQKYAGDFGDGASVKLNKTVNVKGNAKKEADLTDGNIGVVSSQSGDNGQLLIKLNKDLNLGDNGSVKMGNTTINNDGMTISKTESGKTTTVTLTDKGLNNGGNKITNVAAGTDGTDAVNVSQLNDVKTLAGQHTTVEAGSKNITVKEGTNSTGGKNYTVDLAKDVAFGDAAKGDKTVAISGTNGTVMAGTGDNKVTVDGSKGQIIAGGDNGVKIGNVEAGDNSLTIYDKDGNATNQTDKAGKYVTNLGNKTWNKDGSYVSGRAATEDQLHQLESNFNTKVNAVEQNHTVVTVNGSVEAPDAGANGTLGNYTDEKKGNLLLAQKKDSTGKITYDLKLNDKVTLGKAGTNGKDGVDGSIGLKGADGQSSIGLNGKDGISVIGADGKNGVSITGSNGLDGKNGIDGKIAIGTPGKDGQPGKDAVSISGRDGVGHIGLTGPKGADGKDGTNIDISTVLGKGTLDRNQNEVKGEDKDGTKDQAARIQYQTTVREADGTTKPITHEVATMDDGMKYGDDFGNTAKVKLNHQLDIVGDINAGKKDGDKKATKDDLSDGNIGIVATDTVYNDDGTVKENGKMTVKLAKDLKGLNSIESNSVTTGNTTINNGGLTIKTGDANRTITVQDGNVNMGGNQIHHVAPGQAPDDAVNVSQLNATNYAVNKLDTRVNRVGANAAALAALHPLDFDPDDKWDFSAGYGHYKDANAAAVGAFYRPNEDTMFSVGGSFGGGENMVNAGISVKLGQGNHVSTSRVAMAKEIKDLKKDVAALKAVVNQQSALIDKLIGVNAGELSGSDDLFPDVPANHWAYEYVTRLKQAGILTGYPDGNFAGDRMMTRYEFAAIVYRAIMAGAAANPSLNKDGTLDRLAKEFSSEMKYIRIDTIRKDRNGRPTIQRVRVIKEDEKEK